MTSIFLLTDKQQECDLPLYGGSGTTVATATTSTTATLTPASSIEKAKTKSTEEVTNNDDEILTIPSKFLFKLHRKINLRFLSQLYS